jgi:hypothetical protein
MDQRVASRVQSGVTAAAIAVTRTQFENHTGATDRGYVVTDGAARAVVGGTEALLGGFDLGEIVQPQSELAELSGRDAGQWAARLRVLCLTRGVDRQEGDPDYRRADEHTRHRVPPVAADRTMISPRMKL